MADTFVYVLIPSSNAEAMRELVHLKNTSLEDDSLRDALKVHFGQIEGQNAEYETDFQDAVRAQLQNKAVDDQTLKRFAQNVHVDTYPLTIPIKDAPHAVSLYCDAKAHAKGLALNVRACGLAAACGAKHQEFRGDIFLSRYFDDEDQWLREDFRLSDCASDADWIQKAGSRPSSASSLADVYQQLGASSQEPIQIDSRQADLEAMNTEHFETGFSWTQTKEEIEIRIPLPDDILTPKKEVRIQLTRQALTVTAKAHTLLTSPKLHAPIDLEEGYNWTLDRDTPTSPFLVITLNKLETSSPPWPQLGEILPS